MQRDSGRQFEDQVTGVVPPPPVPSLGALIKGGLWHLGRKFFADQMRGEKDMERRLLVQSVTATKGKQSGYQRNVMPGFEKQDELSLQRDRINTIRDVSMMVGIDARCNRLLRKLASDSVLNGLQVIVEDVDGTSQKDEAQTIVDRTRMLIGEADNIQGWGKALLRDGDLFLQLIVNHREKEIIRAKKLAAEITYSRQNAEGGFPKDEKAYYQRDSQVYNRIIREFDIYEIAHAKWDSEDGEPYGRSLFQSIRLAYKRLSSGEDNITIRRHLRAGRRLLHTIGTEEKPAELTEVQEYRNLNQDTIDNPGGPQNDFYSNGRASISEIHGDTDIDNIDDLRHFEGIFSIGTGVPQALISGGREAATNFTVIKEQEEDYIRTLGDIDEQLQRLLKHIFDFALLLKGINPDSVIYVFKWGSKDREDLDMKIDRAIRLLQIGCSFQTAYEHLQLDGITHDMELERIAKQIEDELIPYGINARMDPLIAQLIGYKDVLALPAPANNGNGEGQTNESKPELLELINRLDGFDKRLTTYEQQGFGGRTINDRSASVNGGAQNGSHH